MKKTIIDSFFDRAEKERDDHSLHPLTYEAAIRDYSPGSDSEVQWIGYRQIAIKRHERGIILLAQLSLDNDTKISIAQWNEDSHRAGVPWWFEGEASPSLLRSIQALPDYTPQALADPEMSLDEIHAAQDLVDGI